MADQKKKAKQDGLGRRRRRVKKRDLDRMLRLHDKGWSYYKIAQETGWKRETVKKHITAQLRKEGRQTHESMPSALVAEMRELAQRIEGMTQVPEPDRPLILNTKEERDQITDRLLHGDSQTFSTYTLTCLIFPWWNDRGEVEIRERLDERYKLLLDRLLTLPKCQRLKAELLEWEQRANRYLKAKQYHASTEEIDQMYLDASEASRRLHEEIQRAIWD